MFSGEVVIIGNGFEQRNFPDLPSRRFAEIVILDQCLDQQPHSNLYQMTPESICLEDAISSMQTPIHLPDNSFAMIGQVSHIERKNKEIHLINYDIIDYRYLIVIPVSSYHTPDEDPWIRFSPGIHALTESLKILKKLPQIPSFPLQFKKNAPIKTSLSNNTSPLTVALKNLTDPARAHSSDTTPVSCLIMT